MVTEKGNKRKEHPGTHKNISPKPFVWKMRGAEFFEFLQSVGLKTWAFKGQRGWLGQSPEGTALLLESRQANNQGTDNVEGMI